RGVQVADAGAAPVRAGVVGGGAGEHPARAHAEHHDGRGGGQQQPGAAAYLAVAVPVLVVGGGVGPAGAEEAAPGLLFLHLVAPVEGQVRLLAGVAGVARLVPRVPVGLGVRVTRAVVDGGLGVQVARAV